MAEQPERGPSPVSVVDADGHAVALTTTIESAFGTRTLVAGFLLNNQLTDFSFLPHDRQGRPVANRVEPGKRPRSSMAPTLVFDDTTGELVLSTGSPGGVMIIHYTAKALHGMLVQGLTPQAAIDLPNLGTTGGPLLLEQGRFAPATASGLRALGHTVQEVPLTSGLQALRRQPRGLEGGADPRREGAVAGD
jgi:gamma-glutamyltranspeptidase/glutathione hydrolase